ncbi:segregation/condensation protein A [Streptomyces sp. NPDC086023]|uniref:segregation/condensation protein A n=1 Tax=Streptomyces sp. NPDC086023 TaxID=3365746 RepID=UPI0037D452F3
MPAAAGDRAVPAAPRGDGAAPARPEGEETGAGGNGPAPAEPAPDGAAPAGPGGTGAAPAVPAADGPAPAEPGTGAAPAELGGNGPAPAEPGADGLPPVVPGAGGAVPAVPGAGGLAPVVPGAGGAVPVVPGGDRAVPAVPGADGPASVVRGADGSASVVRGADGSLPAVPGGDGPVPAVPGGDGAAPAEPGGDGRFTVRLHNFEGPFDLLLQLISRHRMDVTEVALSRVTDEFMAHIRAMGPDWDLDQTTEFLVVAATLLDLKAARLLPTAEVEDEADLALLEARDLLFARLLQYRAYKRIAEIFEERAEAEGRRYPRTVGLEDTHAELLPEVVISIGAEGFARLAVKAMQPKAKPQVYVDHIHAPLVSVREQGELLVARLRELGAAGFRELTADAADTLTVVARFLALLELYREKAVALDQEEALGELTVRWTGGTGPGTGGPLVSDEFDQTVRPDEEDAR